MMLKLAFCEIWVRRMDLMQFRWPIVFTEIWVIVEKKLLEGKQVSDQVRETINALYCPHCQNYGIKKGKFPASVDRDEKQVVQADVI